jgi:hypothetical protein
MAGTIVADTLQDGAGNSTAMDNAIYGSAKAWVNFNGATGGIYGSYNVSSVTRTNTGIYTVNINSALPNTTYATFGTINGPNPANCFVYTNCQTRTSTQQNLSNAIYVLIRGTNDSNYDPTFVNISAIT